MPFHLGKLGKWEDYYFYFFGVGLGKGGVGWGRVGLVWFFGSWVGESWWEDEKGRKAMKARAGILIIIIIIIIMRWAVKQSAKKGVTRR